MNASLRFPCFALSLFLLTPSVPGQWTSVGTGIEYRKITTADPNNIYVARMAVNEPSAIIGSTIAYNRIAGANETTSGQFSRYDQALNYWGNSWGQRNDAVVAINGSFSSGGIITGGHIQDSWFAKRFDDWSGQTGFVWKQDRSYFIGGCPHFQASGQTVTINGASRTFEGLNVSRGADQLIVYTPQYNNNTLTDNSGVEVLVEMATPLLTPPGATSGTIKQVRPSQGSTYIPFDHIVLSGSGAAATFLQTYAQAGRQVTLSQNLSLYDGPLGNLCSNPDPRTFNNAYSLVQGNWVFLKSGTILASTDAGMLKKNPRTAVAYNSTYVFFVVCDGRSAASVGWTSDEMAWFCKTNLLATDGVNLDGGGSSAIVVNGVLQNTPSDGAERPIPNGLMMANVLPKTVSGAFTYGQSVGTVGAANIRLGPGTDYYAFTTVSSGAQGTVAAHALNGVYAKGYYWWQCSFGGTTGWVAETLLTNATALIITRQPVSQAAVPGGSATFTVGAVGTSPIGYQWRLYGTNLPGAGANTLTLTNVQAAQAGTYTVVVTNASGSLTSNPAYLALAPKTCTFTALAPVPTLPGDTTNDARALTPDGKWVVGNSYTGGWLSDGTNVFLATVSGAQASQLTGVGYRTENGQQEVVMSGLSSGWNIDYMTTNGTAFGAKRRDTNLGAAPAAVLANGLAGTPSDVFYSTWYDTGPLTSRSYTLYVGRLAGAWPAAPAWESVPVGATAAQTHTVSATGRAVGCRNSPKANYVLDWTGTGIPSAWFFNGLNGTTSGEAFAINADGTVLFGQSPVSGGRAGSWAYKALVTSAKPGTLQSIAELPTLPGTSGSGGSASVPYGCTADGNYAVGACSVGSDKAVLWDTHDASPANWTVLDLTQMASTNGSLGIFSRLTRAYSIGANAAGLVIAGTGVDTNAAANPRAFLLTVAFPKTLVPASPQVAIYPASPGYRFSFDTVADAGVTYYLEYTPNLAPNASWSPIAQTPGTGSPASLFDRTPSGATRFYRVRAQ